MGWGWVHIPYSTFLSSQHNLLNKQSSCPGFETPSRPQYVTVMYLLSHTAINPFAMRFNDSCFPWGHRHSSFDSLTLTPDGPIQNDASCETGQLESVMDTRIKPYLTADHDWCDEKHPCGYYDKTYKWCNMQDGNWEYCCDGECSNYLCSTGKNHMQRRCSPLVWKTETGKLLIQQLGMLLLLLLLLFFV